MTTSDVVMPTVVSPPRAAGATIGRRLHDVWAMARRSLVHISREPMQLSDVTLQPVLFPLAFISNAMIPTQHMPGWLQVVADWNPVSAVTAGARHLWGNPNPSASVHDWPVQYPVLAAVVWSVAIVAIGAPFAARLFKARTTE